MRKNPKTNKLEEIFFHNTKIGKSNPSETSMSIRCRELKTDKEGKIVHDDHGNAEYAYTEARAITDEKEIKDIFTEIKNIANQTMDHAENAVSSKYALLQTNEEIKNIAKNEKKNKSIKTEDKK